eukprot:gene8718-6127_t
MSVLVESGGSPPLHPPFPSCACNICGPKRCLLIPRCLCANVTPVWEMMAGIFLLYGNHSILTAVPIESIVFLAGNKNDSERSYLANTLKGPGVAEPHLTYRLLSPIVEKKRGRSECTPVEELKRGKEIHHHAKGALMDWLFRLSLNLLNTAWYANPPQYQFPPVIDLSGSHEHYPFCLVWSPLPGITSVLPFIGHVGIADSKGKLYDFQGDFKIGKDRMLFGKIVKYIDLSREYVPSAYANPPASPEVIQAEVEAYDKALMDMVSHYKQTQHYDFVRNNCHNFAADVLNSNPRFPGVQSKWTVANIMWRFVS